MFSSLFAKVFASSSVVSATAPATSVSVNCDVPSLQIPIALNPRNSKRIAQVKELAHAYEHGPGVQEDMAMAISYYQEGAALGGAYAIFKLAGFYANGTNIPLDLEKAAMWYKLGMKLYPNETIFSSKYNDLMSK